MDKGVKDVGSPLVAVDEASDEMDAAEEGRLGGGDQRSAGHEDGRADDPGLGSDALVAGKGALASQSEDVAMDGPRAPTDLLEAAGLAHDVLALSVEEAREDGGAVRVKSPKPEEAESRRRLAGAVLGVGGPLARLLDGTAKGHVDVDVAKGVVYALTADSGSIEVSLLAHLAAAGYVVQGRLLEATAKATKDVGSGSGRQAFEYARAANVNFRLFERTLEAVDLARARRRDRTSVPRFALLRVGVEGTGRRQP